MKKNVMLEKTFKN